MHYIHKRAAIRHALLILPAVALGVLAMVSGGVSSLLWGQQLAAWLLLSLLIMPLRRPAGRIPDIAWQVILCAVPALSLLGTDAGGAKRWLDLGVFNINATMLTLPALLVVLHRAKQPHIALLAAAFVLCLQPDLSQLTALILAALPVLWLHRKKLPLTIISIIVLCALEIRCVGIRVTPEPIAYCEGILDMLGGISPLLAAAGCAALAAVPVCLLYRAVRHRQSSFVSLAVYYAASMLFVLSGEYPVPFMGFGLSPIAGYCLAYVCTKGKTSESNEDTD